MGLTRRFVDHQLAVLHAGRDGHPQHVAEDGSTVLLGWGTHDNKMQFGVVHAGPWIGAEAQAARTQAFADEVRSPGSWVVKTTGGPRV